MKKETQGKKIAIIGATSHIAKGLIYNFCNRGEYELFLFARSLDRLKNFLNNIGCNRIYSIKPFSEFNNNKYDVVINCVGIGDTAKQKDEISSIFGLTEAFDSLILDYLKAHPKAFYINFSSGAVYGTDFSASVDELTFSKWDINHITQDDYYGVAKLNAEVKHRSFANLNIVDLRVFGYFSRFIEFEAKFLMSEVISCVKNKKEFVTGPTNIVRDYVHPQDLVSLIERCIDIRHLNNAYDVYSLKPITKFEILNYFSIRYGLKYVIEGGHASLTATGNKENYYSNNKRAQAIGYSPQFTSLDSIIQESMAILGAN